MSTERVTPNEGAEVDIEFENFPVGFVGIMRLGLKPSLVIELSPGKTEDGALIAVNTYGGLEMAEPERRGEVVDLLQKIAAMLEGKFGTPEFVDNVPGSRGDAKEKDA